MGAPLISFNRVTFTYDNGHEVFRDATFNINSGDFYYLTGPSGAGKSTLLKLLYLANSYYIGSIDVFGREIKSLNERELPAFRRNIGIVFQEFSLLEHLSTVDNVALPLILAGTNSTAAREKATEILSWLGLGNFIYKLPALLSGGQRQRVAIARAVIHSPQLVLADEPTGNVDDENAVKLLFLFERLNKSGTTVIFATHNRDLINEFPYPQININSGNVTQIIPEPAYLKEVQHGA
jgi:cell division transport system ATP-binding protein